MKRQLAQMQYGEDGSGRQGASVSGDGRGDFYVPPARLPEVGLELTRLVREVKVQETLVTLLTQQFEQVRIAEARDMPIVQVLDRAVPAVYPSKPRLWLNLALAGTGSLLAGLCLAFLLLVLPASMMLVQPEGASGTSPSEPLPKIAPAPEFTLTSQDGAQISLTKLWTLKAWQSSISMWRMNGCCLNG